MISPKSSKPLIVLAPSGTLEDFDREYGPLLKAVHQSFPAHEVRWCYVSEAILKRLPAEARSRLSMGAVFRQLVEEGFRRGVVQSLHVIRGSEFERLEKAAPALEGQWRIGGPLLDDDRDFTDCMELIRNVRSHHPDVDTVVLVVHGTDHPAGKSYRELEERVLRRFGDRVCVGSLSGHPGKMGVMEELRRKKARRIHLIPFLFSVGRHVRYDILNGEGSWSNELQSKGYDVSATSHGLSRHPAAIRAFVRHISETLEALNRTI
jgi:sirohydrochlorin cobaltochelatase